MQLSLVLGSVLLFLLLLSTGISLLLICPDSSSSSSFGHGLLMLSLQLAMLTLTGFWLAVASIFWINVLTWNILQHQPQDSFSFSLWPFLLHLFVFWDLHPFVSASVILDSNSPLSILIYFLLDLWHYMDGRIQLKRWGEDDGSTSWTCLTV